jgi:hypothetical protein
MLKALNLGELGTYAWNLLHHSTATYISCMRTITTKPIKCGIAMKLEHKRGAMEGAWSWPN